MHILFEPVIPEGDMLEKHLYAKKEIHTRTFYETVVILITKSEIKAIYKEKILNAVRNEVNK